MHFHRYRLVRLATMAIFIFEAAVRGYHVYKNIWNPCVGEEFPAKRERGNANGRYAVCVKKDGRIVGHLPQELSKVAWHFLKRGGAIVVEVCGRRRCSPLEQGGLEIPCFIKFTGKEKLVENLRTLLKK